MHTAVTYSDEAHTHTQAILWDASSGSTSMLLFYPGVHLLYGLDSEWVFNSRPKDCALQPQRPKMF